jgi:hypothetical protein
MFWVRIRHPIARPFGSSTLLMSLYVKKNCACGFVVDDTLHTPSDSSSFSPIDGMAYSNWDGDRFSMSQMEYAATNAQAAYLVARHALSRVAVPSAVEPQLSAQSVAELIGSSSQTTPSFATVSAACNIYHLSDTSTAFCKVCRVFHLVFMSRYTGWRLCFHFFIYFSSNSTALTLRACARMRVFSTLVLPDCF